jgi:hypothetical protein
VSLVPPNDASGEDDLEELGDDVIIAQQSVAHAPPPAAHVEDEKRSVVISDTPPGGAAPLPTPAPAAPAQSPSRGRTRGRAEATVVIRDRRKLEQMRKEIRESQRAHRRRSSKPPRPYLVWGGAALAAFVLGGLVALVVGVLTAPGPVVIPDPPAATAAPQDLQPTAAPTVNLEDLPVEKK